MENKYGLYSQGSSGWTSMRNEEFQEGDVWEVLKKIKDYDCTIPRSTEEPPPIAKRLPTAAKMIPKSYAKNSTSQQPKTIGRQSAPLDIPDWSKIYGASSKKSSSSWLDPDSNDDDGSDHRHHHHGFRGNSWESEDECQVDGDGSMMIPPHEWIARRISSFSVCEGAGRTLKGRDLSRVRNSVLTKTGFLEPKSHH
ncbi:hypothetical protein C2S52_005936 [Perilla frutescens var. hirtella]|nr:hypothetical protein C2S52_005936 [Perilla frutescens var. hirtella]